MTRSPVPRQRRLEMLDTLTPPPPCLPASRTTAIRHPFSGYHSPCMRACMCNRGSEGASHSTGPTVPHRHRHRTHHEGAKDALALATHVGAVRAAHVPSQSARDREPHRVAHKRGVRVTCGLRWVGRVACAGWDVWPASGARQKSHVHTFTLRGHIQHESGLGFCGTQQPLPCTTEIIPVDVKRRQRAVDARAKRLADQLGASGADPLVRGVD